MRVRPRTRMSSSQRDAAVQAIPEFAVSLFTILLIWLFAELIFLPLSAESFTREISSRVTPIVATAFILAIGYLLPKTARRGETAVKILSDTMVKGRYGRRHRDMRKVFESLGRALLSAILGIVFGSLLYWIHPVFGGMAILVMVVIVFIFIFQGASQASDEILKRVSG